MAKPGRHKQEIIKEKIVSVRFTPDEYERLKLHSEESHKTISCVIKEGIDNIIKADL